MLQKNDRIISDNLKTGAIPKHETRCENDWGCVGFLLAQESTLDVDTYVHVLLSNMELRQNE